MNSATVSRSALLKDVRPSHAVKVQLRGEKTSYQPEWLTAAITACVHAERGFLKAIAARLGVAYETARGVADWLDTKPLKAWWIPAIVQETKSLAVLQAIAEQCGCVVVPLPVATNVEHADLVHRAAIVMSETGETVTALGHALSDGKLTQEERVHLSSQIREAHEALAALQLVIDQKAR